MPPTTLASLFSELEETAHQAQLFHATTEHYGHVCFALASQIQNLIERERKIREERDEILLFMRRVLVLYHNACVEEEEDYFLNIARLRVMIHAEGLVAKLLVVSGGNTNQCFLAASCRIYQSLGQACRQRQEVHLLPAPIQASKAAASDPNDIPGRKTHVPYMRLVN